MKENNKWNEKSINKLMKQTVKTINNSGYLLIAMEDAFEVELLKDENEMMSGYEKKLDEIIDLYNKGQTKIAKKHIKDLIITLKDDTKKLDKKFGKPKSSSRDLHYSTRLHFDTIALFLEDVQKNTIDAEEIKDLVIYHIKRYNPYYRDKIKDLYEHLQYSYEHGYKETNIEANQRKEAIKEFCKMYNFDIEKVVNPEKENDFIFIKEEEIEENRETINNFKADVEIEPEKEKQVIEFYMTTKNHANDLDKLKRMKSFIGQRVIDFPKKIHPITEDFLNQMKGLFIEFTECEYNGFTDKTKVREIVFDIRGRFGAELQKYNKTNIDEVEIMDYFRDYYMVKGIEAKIAKIENEKKIDNSVQKEENKQEIKHTVNTQEKDKKVDNFVQKELKKEEVKKRKSSKLAGHYDEAKEEVKAEYDRIMKKSFTSTLNKMSNEEIAYLNSIYKLQISKIDMDNLSKEDAIVIATAKKISNRYNKLARTGVELNSTTDVMAQSKAEQIINKKL